ncbi:MAG: ribulose-phosphate 3-epimerase [Candidatus ainarchaeum sp.]|nr:ribulose-phosphate 3-epimerase [Candidatus ainarchaeum sp.]
MNGTNLHTRETEIVPAVLAKTRELLLNSINRVRPYAHSVHIDVLDNVFVPNLTVGLEDLKSLPKDVKYEFHWMVREPEKWISEIQGVNTHIVHIETIGANWEKIKLAARKTGSTLGLAINPETSVEKLLPYAKDVQILLVMSVHPGFSGQKYIKEVEEKIAFLRKKFPSLAIEVDGGISEENAFAAVKQGANRLAAASAIFGHENVEEAIQRLRKASGGHAN